MSARKNRAQDRSVCGIHEDPSTELTPKLREKTIFRGALKKLGVKDDHTARLQPNYNNYRHCLFFCEHFLFAEEDQAGEAKFSKLIVGANLTGFTIFHNPTKSPLLVARPSNGLLVSYYR